MPENGIEPLSISEPFCDGKWKSNGYQHWCLKRLGHDGPCWCCDQYEGGDLSSLEREMADD